MPAYRPLLLSSFVLLASVPAVSGLAAPLAGKTAPGADGDGRDVHTVMIHGLHRKGTATSNCSNWNDTKRALSAFGYDLGRIHAVRYYGHEESCSDDINQHGSHSVHHPSGHVYPNGHDQEASIRHLSYHLAWFLNDEFTEKGRPVQVVAASMGGLIIRYALAQIERGHPEFPSEVEVEDVVTLGSPHDGSGFATSCRQAQQCKEMIPDSDFMDWLNEYATHPDGQGGTNWTTVGSYADDLVGPSSAVHMDADHKVKYLSRSGIEHTDYYRATSNVLTASVEWLDKGGTWYEWYGAPWPVRWTDFALYHPSW